MAYVVCGVHDSGRVGPMHLYHGASLGCVQGNGSHIWR